MLGLFLIVHWALTFLNYTWLILAGTLEAEAAPAYCGVRGSHVGRVRKLDSLTLTSIQAVVRHGARTPVCDCAPYLPAAGGAEWHCGNGIVEGVALDRIAPESDAILLQRPAYRKRYAGGALPGTCETGQLLDEGYAQHKALGEALRETYVDGLDLAPTISLRSSDLSRTRQSAEALADAFAPGSATVIETTDFSADWIYPNAAECPALPAREREAYADAAFLAWNASAPRKALGARLDAAIGHWQYGFDMAGGHLMDCALTAACEGRGELLGALSEADVDDLVSQMEAREYFKLRHRNRIYSKTAAAPLLAALREGLRAESRGLRVFAAHDTSLMPLLVALGANETTWPPYAAAIVFERWRDDGGAVFVRAVYEGRVVVELAALDEFLDATAWVSDRDCAVSEEPVLRTSAPFSFSPLPLAMAFLLGGVVGGLLGRRRRPTRPEGAYQKV